MKISIVGAGYVGLVSGACLAHCGHEVVCVDLRRDVVEKINQGIPPIHEEGLAALIGESSSLRASLDLEATVLNTEITFIAVGTPFDGQQIDLSQIKEVASQVGACLRNKTDRHVVVVKSTVVPGTTQDVIAPLLEEFSGKSVGHEIGLAMNPEFLREGEAVNDFMQPDRIVLGVTDGATESTLRRVYQSFSDTPIMVTSPSTAEMIKYTSNSLLASLISFSNEIANIAAMVDDVDVVDVMAGVHADKRLTPKLANGSYIRPGVLDYIKPGCGFGGSCFPKDVKALASFSRSLGYEAKMLDSVMVINSEQAQKTVALAKRHYPSLKDVSVTVCGVTFKPGTDDVRESPALKIIKLLQAEGAIVSVVDPCINPNVDALNSNLPMGVMVIDSLQNAVAQSEVLIMVTPWPMFDQLPALVAEQSEPPLLVDGRRYFDPSMFSRYEGIGL